MRACPTRACVEVFAELGLDEWLSALPAGLDTPLGAGGRGLSAGEAQLVALARVFLKDPGLVVLDEASSRLDPHTERLLERAVTRLLDGRTGIVIAHRLATVERADRILILEHGRVAELGRRADLARDPAIALRPAAARRDDGGAGVRPIIGASAAGALHSGLLRGDTFFAILVYFILPIPLGLATRAFFDALAGQSVGVERLERDRPAGRRSGRRGGRRPCTRQSVEPVTAEEPGAAAAEPVRRHPARLRPLRAARVGRRDDQPLPRRPARASPTRSTPCAT